PKLDAPPEEWKAWHEHHKTEIRGVMLMSGNVADIRAIRGRLLVARLAPDSSRRRSVFMLRAAELLVVPGFYRELLMHLGMDVAATRTFDNYAGPSDALDTVDIAMHFARNGVTWAEADDAWMFADAW
ncbi:hypothetical protein BJ138DRAFT_994239, partial [Hygrophoropsis aurantiaca]